MGNLQTILIILFLLISLTQSISTFTYSFPYNGASPQSNLNYYPAYQLGILSLNYSITIRITVPNTASSELSSLVSALSLKFIDSTNGNVLVDAVNANGSPFVFPGGFDTTYSATYAIKFPSTYTLTSASFILFLADNSAIHSSLKLDYFNLEITSFPTVQGISVNNAKSVSTILKVTEIMRDKIVKLIYVSQSNQLYNFSAFPASYFDYSTGIAMQQDMYMLTLYSVDVPSLLTQGFTTNDLTLSLLTSVITNQRAESIATNSQVEYKANVGHYSYEFVAPGFYLLQFQILQSSAFTGTITFNSDRYACPYSSDFTDYYSNFQPCSSSVSMATDDLPCLGYDAITRLCALCARGYTLKDGQCLVNTTCPQRQYYYYGTCTAVNQACGDYDYFTGKCINCRNATNYTFKNGQCIEIVVTCGSRQWKFNRTCFNVSQTCDKFDQSNGSCLSCKSNLSELNANGSCIPVVITCPQGQYLLKNKCLAIPNQCLVFNVENQQCLTCIRGYLLKNGTCQVIVCPSRQFVPQNSIECRNVSQLCGDFNSSSGECLNCKNPTYTFRNGACVQVVSALAGCKQRERLGFGPCIGDEVNCKVFNIVSGNCQTCIPNHYLDYAGHCRLNANCSAGQWSTNGQCLKMPANCLQVNELGFCTRCANKTYRIVQGQCLFFQTCGNRQYLNANGTCKKVSPSCATWNPSNGLCITCVTAGSQPNSGVCCPFGQIFFQARCVAVVTLQNSKKINNGNSNGNCVVRHPSLYFCLQCDDGFTAVYSPPYNCVQSN